MRPKAQYMQKSLSLCYKNRLVENLQVFVCTKYSAKKNNMRERLFGRGEPNFEIHMPPRKSLKTVAPIQVPTFCSMTFFVVFFT